MTRFLAKLRAVFRRVLLGPDQLRGRTLTTRELTDEVSVFRGSIRLVIALLLISTLAIGFGTWLSHRSNSGADARIEQQNAEIAAQNASLRKQNAKLQAIIEDIEESRSRNIVGSCDQYNEAVTRAIDLGAEDGRERAEDLIEQFKAAGAPSNPENEARFVRGQTEAARSAAAKINRYRDCSTAEAIAQFYENAPPTRPCPNGNDGKGYCR